MHLLRIFSLIAVFTIMNADSARSQTSWSILDGYQISFSGRGAEGTFRGLEGTIEFSPDQLSKSRFDVSLDPSSIDTDNSLKNKHARGEDWFHVKKYPKITFKSSEIRAKEDGFEVEGEMTVHGISKTISFDFTFEEKAEKRAENKSEDRPEERADFKGSFTLSREAFGIEGPFISFMVGDDFEVKVVVPVEAKP